MGMALKIRISGSGPESDAPSAEDLLDHVRDYLDILRGVEEAVAEDGTSAIDWRVVNASRNSPLGLELEAFPRQYATNVDRRVALVIGHTAVGLELLQRDAERPAFFTDKVMTRARSMFQRVTNGLNLTEVDFGQGLPEIRITPTSAREAAANADRVLKPLDKPYREQGSIEGYFQGVERDGHGRRVLYIRHRSTGEPVKCLLGGLALMKVEEHHIADVFRHRRIQVLGTINYKSLGRISYVEGADVRFLRSREQLPQVDDIIDREFTGGLRSEDYIDEVRNGGLA